MTIIDQADEALALEAGESLHLIEKQASCGSVSQLVAFLHAAEILVAFVDGHLFVCGHSSLG
jgi:hypothetical protein